MVRIDMVFGLRQKAVFGFYKIWLFSSIISTTTIITNTMQVDL